MKQRFKSCLTVLLVIGASVIFSLQLRWLSQRNVFRSGERERETLTAYAVVLQEARASQSAKSG